MAKQVIRRKETSRRKVKAYLTKRSLIRATNKATSNLMEDAMKLKGYIIKAEGGWVVRIDNKGNRTRLSRISSIKSARKVALR